MKNFKIGDIVKIRKTGDIGTIASFCKCSTCNNPGQRTVNIRLNSDIFTRYYVSLKEIDKINSAKKLSDKKLSVESKQVEQMELF